MRSMEISVGVDRPSIPRDCLIPEAETDLRDARVVQPQISRRVPRAETQRFLNEGLRLFRIACQILSHPDQGICVGKILIQGQRMFTFSDALRGALGVNV